MNSGSHPDSSLLVWLVSFLILVLVQRVGELMHSAHNGRVLRARGAKEHGASHFPLLVIVHVLFPVSLVLEVVFLGARPGSWWGAWLVLWCSAQFLRYWAVLSLGDRWNARILVLPGVPVVSRGPYAFLTHPNYVAVAIELLVAPLMFGAWRTALGISLLNLFALWIRICAEERALAQGASCKDYNEP